MINRFQIGSLIFDSTGTKAEAMSGSEILDEIQQMNFNLFQSQNLKYLCNIVKALNSVYKIYFFKEIDHSVSTNRPQSLQVDSYQAIKKFVRDFNVERHRLLDNKCALLNSIWKQANQQDLVN